LVGDEHLFVFNRPRVAARVGEVIGTLAHRGTCLVTGERDQPIELCHLVIKNLYDASKDPNVVSFNKPAFNSFGKEQCANAPVSQAASLAYAKALNHLMARDSRQKLHVGDATVVFWSKKESQFDSEMPLFFDEPPKDDPDKNTPAVKAVYASIWNGAYAVPDDDTPFYVLGLSPNSARITVRFWHAATIKEIGKRFKQHVDDLTITHRDDTNPALPIRRLLHSIAALGKSENIPPNLAGDTMRAILEGLPYPQTLLQGCIQRMKADQAKKDKKTGKSVPNVTYERAALIKAIINRKTSFPNSNNKEELKVSLDTSNTSIGYRLGRLFATLEKIQGEAHPGINATIRDRFYGAASSSPITVFSRLISLNTHHIAKLDKAGRKTFFKNLLGEIIDGVDGKIAFPAHLDLEQQGRFAIGYYHQTQNLFMKKTEPKAE